MPLQCATECGQLDVIQVGLGNVLPLRTPVLKQELYGACCSRNWLGGPGNAKGVSSSPHRPTQCSSFLETGSLESDLFQMYSCAYVRVCAGAQF